MKNISRKQALEDEVKICMEKVQLAFEDQGRYECVDGIPPGCHIYAKPEEPCWCIFAPWEATLNHVQIHGSRIILIAKAGGRVLYDGPANDEG